MKNISILVPERARLSSIEIPRHAFTEVNDISIAEGNPPLFNVQMVGLTKVIQLNDGLYSIKTDILLKDVEKTDLIIVPAMQGNLQEALRLNREFIPWIIKQYKSGAEVASLCVGAFLLAATGLLKGKQCSTHWRAANDFRVVFPDVNLVVDKILTDEQGIYSSGGSFSSSNLILYLVEKYAGRDIAVRCSKLFQIDIERDSQSPFIMFRGQKEHKDEPVKKAQEFIEVNFKKKITVDQLSDIFGIGRRTFERRFKAATFNSIVEYMQRVKVEAAKKQLETGRKTVNEVMYDVGYTDNKAFRDVFKKIAGMSPIDYRNRYNKERVS
ncbi:MAG: helix-turn-helix domain-containing protein [Ignavibacteriaceae bacterium]|nr:helix-turn-helix domain-containing protein [Ignavibacteriaceae bacterium]